MRCRKAMGRRLVTRAVAASALLGLNLGTVDASGLPPGLSLTVEGGAACALGDSGTLSARHELRFGASDPVTATASTQHPDDRCGWTGRVGLVQERPSALFGIGDDWGLFVRHSDFGSGRFSASDRETDRVLTTDLASSVEIEGRASEDRTVVDFEVGRLIGRDARAAQPAKTVRLFGGVRYAKYKATLQAPGRAGFDLHETSDNIILGADEPFALSARHKFQGFGPRIGLMLRKPVTGHIDLVATGAGSALWGRHNVRFAAAGPDLENAFSTAGNDWVFNVESEVGLSFRPFGPSGMEIIGGVRAEFWFDQARLDAVAFRAETVTDGIDVMTTSSATHTGRARDRHNWGPFLRANIPLSEPAR